MTFNLVSDEAIILNFRLLQCSKAEILPSPSTPYIKTCLTSVTIIYLLCLCMK